MHSFKRGQKANKEYMKNLDILYSRFESKKTFQNNVRKVCAQDNPLQVEKAILGKSNKSIENNLAFTIRKSCMLV